MGVDLTVGNVTLAVLRVGLNWRLTHSLPLLMVCDFTWVLQTYRGPGSSGD